MSLLKSIPSFEELEKYYSLLLPNQQKLIPIAKIVECVHFCRFDPRLAELVVVYFSKRWREYAPLELGEDLSNNRLSARFGVLLEFSGKILHESERELFRNWKNMVVHKATPAEGEQYFIGLWPIGSSRMAESAEFSSGEYEKWGYLGRAILCPKSEQMYFSKTTRKRILESMLQTQKQFSAKEYWEAIGRSVSLRQAERDLLMHKNISSRGYTRNKRYNL